jgi:hypothetical protein
VIPRASWRAIKDRLGRRQAFIATTVDRAAIRTVIRNAHRHYAIARAGDVLPISTMQWSSVMMHHDGSHIALVDVEQANAVSFLFARMAWLEHPIFSFIEFMIRAAETFYDDGDLTLAAAIAERANDRLWAYCRYHETEARVLRPVAIDELLPTILKSRLILAFITGHEIGHLVQASEDPGTQPLFDWVAARHDAINTDRKDPKLPFERFLEPEVTQKFDTDGVPTGFLIQTTKFARQFLHMRRQQIQETQADALGVILATQTAIDAGIAVEDLFGFFPKILEHTDMLMMLRRTVARLPRGEKSSAIATERSSLFARLCLYIKLVRGLRDGAVDAPAEVVAYWSGLAEQDLVTMERAANDGTLDVLAMRAALMCRGGIEVGLHGNCPIPCPTTTTTLARSAATYQWHMPIASCPTGCFGSRPVSTGSRTTPLPTPWSMALPARSATSPRSAPQRPGCAGAWAAVTSCVRDRTRSLSSCCVVPGVRPSAGNSTLGGAGSRRSCGIATNRPVRPDQGLRTLMRSPRILMVW